MKGKRNEGFTLLETLIAIVILGIVVVPVCSSLVMSFRINAKADQLLRDQLAVSSAVETLMAEGIQITYLRADKAEDNYGWEKVVVNEGEEPEDKDRFPETNIVVTPGDNVSYYEVAVEAGDVTVTTQIRAAKTNPTEEPEGGGE